LQKPCTLRGAGTDHAPERAVPSVEQVQALTLAMPERYRIAVVLAAWGTLRSSEILALQRKDVDLRAGSVRVTKQLLDLGSHSDKVQFSPTKSAAGVRTVHLPAAALVHLAHHLEHHVGPEADSFLLTGATGRPMWRKALGRHWRAARAAVGVPWLHFHDLRHFAGTMAAQAGATTRDLMTRMWHSSPDMVVRYMHMSAERDAELASKIDDLAVFAGNFASTRVQHQEQGQVARRKTPFY
jgi:integrase